MSDDRLSEEERTNLSYWEELVGIHLAAGSDYSLDRFLSGESALDPLVAGEIGSVSGLRLLHLQCHFGLDTLSLARLGAEVVGIDFSPEAIKQARALSERSGVPGQFVQSRVQDVPEAVEGPFDTVFTSWGAICWLNDLDRWAEVIAWALKPGGTFYMAEGHPLAQALAEDPGPVANPIIVEWPMMSHEEALEWHTHEDYANPEAEIHNSKTLEWNHDLGTVVTSLIKHGLTLEFLHEHPVLTWQASKAMVKRDEHFYHFAPPLPPVPLSFSLRARKT